MVAADKAFGTVLICPNALKLLKNRHSRQAGKSEKPHAITWAALTIFMCRCTYTSISLHKHESIEGVGLKSFRIFFLHVETVCDNV